MPTYLERYLAGEREAAWTELTALEDAIAEEPLATDAQAVADETMRRARANVELLVQRLTTLGYRFINTTRGQPPAPHTPPTEDSLADLRALEAQHGVLPLSLHAWYTIVGAVDFIGSYPRLSSYHVVDLSDMQMYFQGKRLRVSFSPEIRVLGPAPEPDPDPDAGIPSDPLVVDPCAGAMIADWEEDDESPDQPATAAGGRVSLFFAPDALHKANVSGGDGPYVDFLPRPRMDATLGGDDWDGVPFITYLRTVFAWGGFPGLRAARNPPRDLLAVLCEGLLPL